MRISIGQVVVTVGPDRDLRTLMIHLQSAGIQHVIEARRVRKTDSSRSCTSDRRMHSFVEEVSNGALRRADGDFGYRCVDFLDGAKAEEVAQRVSDLNLDIVAVLPRAAEDVVPETDSLAQALHSPLISNEAAWDPFLSMIVKNGSNWLVNTLELLLLIILSTAK